MLTLKVPNWKTPSTTRGTANLIFNQPGRYASPSGLQSVEIWVGDDGLLHLRVQDKNGSSAMSGFSPDSDWMMCWDKNDQLWFYNPDEGPTYCRAFYVGPNVRGSRTCGEGGGWEGIPEVFLNQLPEEARATYRLAQMRQASLTK